MEGLIEASPASALPDWDWRLDFPQGQEQWAFSDFRRQEQQATVGGPPQSRRVADSHAIPTSLVCESNLQGPRSCNEACLAIRILVLASSRVPINPIRTSNNNPFVVLRPNGRTKPVDPPGELQAPIPFGHQLHHGRTFHQINSSLASSSVLWDHADQFFVNPHSSTPYRHSSALPTHESPPVAPGLLPSCPPEPFALDPSRTLVVAPRVPRAAFGNKTTDSTGCHWVTSSSPPETLSLHGCLVSSHLDLSTSLTGVLHSLSSPHPQPSRCRTPEAPLGRRTMTPIPLVPTMHRDPRARR